MKKFLLSLATAFSFVLFLGSCTNEEDINNNGYSDKEKAKIETLMNLFDSYGWELDTTVSIEQRNKELLEMDYEKTKSFLEYMSNGIEFDNFEPTQQNEDNAPKALSNTRSTMTFPIYGSHSSAVASSILLSAFLFIHLLKILIIPLVVIPVLGCIHPQITHQTGEQ